MSKSFNIKPSDATYFINEEKKVVVCTIDKTQYLFINFVRENFKIWPNNICDDNFLWCKLIMPNKFTGVARCSESDEWNVETGKLIAFSRMKDNLNKSFFKRANTYVNFLDRAADEAADVLGKIGEKLSVNTEHRHNLIDSIIGEEPKDGVQAD